MLYKRRILLILVSLLCFSLSDANQKNPGSKKSKQLNQIDKIITHPELKEWKDYFFKPNAPLESQKPRKLELHGSNVEELKEIKNDTLYYKCNSAKTRCISMLYDFEIEIEDGKPTVQGLEPHSYVILIDYKIIKEYRIVECGSIGSIHGAFWYNDHIVVGYGINRHDFDLDIEVQEGFIVEVNLNTLTFTYHILNDKYKNLGATPDEYLIKKFF